MAGHRTRRCARHYLSLSLSSCEHIPPEWAQHCEDAFHLGHSNQQADLAARLDLLISTGKFPKFEDKVRPLGSYGGGNHLGECEAVQIADNGRARRAAEVFGLRDGCVAFLSHCGSRGLASEVARLRARFVIKDSDDSLKDVA